MRRQIKEFFYDQDIVMDIWVEKKQSLSIFNYIKDNLALARYCGIFVVGCEEVVHEVVNGMLNRNDKLNLPIGVISKTFLPKQTHDLAQSFLINSKSIPDSQNVLLKGDLLPTDVTKITVDGFECQDSSKISGSDLFNGVRYSTSCINFTGMKLE